MFVPGFKTMLIAFAEHGEFPSKIERIPPVGKYSERKASQEWRTPCCWREIRKRSKIRKASWRAALHVDLKGDRVRLTTKYRSGNRLLSGVGDGLLWAA
jgi:hypothetical protein